LLEQVAQAGRADAAAAARFHAAAAAELGLSASEERALDLIELNGPLTAGELAKQSGLAPASVTGLVDRLQRKGFARRIPHPTDQRRVLIEIGEAPVARILPLVKDFLDSLEELYARYTDDELEAIASYLTEVAGLQRTAADNLQARQRRR
jgi:DNA-binding MarR family transcriptional regulator